MHIGVYTAILHDRDIDSALDIIKDIGLNGAEINSGGFLPAVHLPISEVMSSDVKRDEYLDKFSSRGIKLTALNCNGNPLSPNKSVGTRQSQDVVDSIKLAQRLGVDRVITMSGLPAAESTGTRSAWYVNPWSSEHSDALDYQWEEVAVPFWKKMDQLAADHGVKVALEMHPQNVVFNPATLVRLIEKGNLTNVGAEMDPSHLFWQQIDPITALKFLGELVFAAAAKDVRINPSVSLHGVLDDRFTRIPREKNPLPISHDGQFVVNKWPEDSAWDFVALGQGHSQEFWNQFLQTLSQTSPACDIAIEHEDAAFGRVEGLKIAAEVLRTAYETI
jgi:sugar phosphate isomerase/epimerase